MAAPIGVTGTAESNPTSTPGDPGVYTPASGTGPGQDPDPKHFNHPYRVKVLVGGNQTPTLIDSSDIYRAAALQQPVIRDFNPPNAPQRDPQLFMYIHGIEVFGNAGTLVIGLSPTTLPGAPFMPRSQTYDIGIPESTRPRMAYHYPHEVTTNHPVNVTDTNIIFEIQTENYAGDVGSWFGWVDVSVKSRRFVALPALPTFMKITGNPTKADLKTEESRNAYDLKRKADFVHHAIATI